MSTDAPKPGSLTPSNDGNARPALTPEEAEQRRKQREALNLFGMIDFDPDWDPIKQRERDREQLRQEIAHHR